MNRATWKAYYRLLRICRREAAKASIDMMLFGNGFVDTSGSEPRHIPIEQVYFRV